MSVADELQRLQSLHASGALTDAEFEKAKSAVLASSPTRPPVYRSSGDSEPSEFDALRKLKRSSTDAFIGGVCGGLGASTPLPSWAWRVIFLLGFLSFGIGLIPYIVLWICIPSDERT